MAPLQLDWTSFDTLISLAKSPQIQMSNAEVSGSFSPSPTERLEQSDSGGAVHLGMSVIIGMVHCLT